MLQTLPAEMESSLLFERSGCACAIVLPGSWQVLAVTERYLEILQQPRDLVVGHNLFEIYGRKAP